MNLRFWLHRHHLVSEPKDGWERKRKIRFCSDVQRYENPSKGNCKYYKHARQLENNTKICLMSYQHIDHEEEHQEHQEEQIEHMSFEERMLRAL
jgi:hypothetical protein